MFINCRLLAAVIVEPGQYQWAASPQQGVERMMLDRIGAEQARATSIVRYAPDSRFPPHAHPGGEEIQGRVLYMKTGHLAHPVSSRSASPARLRARTAGAGACRTRCR
jgi:anti-sigma factor ChrR (cupin superfamily)